MPQLSTPKTRPQTAEPIMDYASWLKAQQEAGTEQGRHWRRVREPGELDPSLQEAQQRQLEEEARRLDQLHQLQHAHADTLEVLLEQTQAEARKRAAVFNVAAADQHQQGKQEQRAAARTEQPASFVFPQRPSTSKSALRRAQADYSQFLHQQAEARAARDHESQEHEMQVGGGWEEGDTDVGNRIPPPQEDKAWLNQHVAKLQADQMAALRREQEVRVVAAE